MSYKTFSIDDFSGGLNTAVAQSRLDVRFSPDLQNVDFTETGAITRRKGYTVVTPSAFSSSVKALHRYYQADSNKFWVVVSGTAVYTAESVVTEVAPTTLEAEDGTFASGSVGEFTFSRYSGGAAMRVTSASAVFTVPSYCTRVDIHSNCSALLGASFSVDGGAYVSATTAVKTIGSLGGTPSTRSIKVKPATRNDKSVKLWVRTTENPSGNEPTMPPNKIAVMRSVALDVTKTVSIRFYDSGETTQPTSGFRTGVSFIPPGSTVTWQNGYAIYRENTVYKYRTPTGSTGTIGITPSVGWHTVTFKNGNRLTLDDTLVAYVPYSSSYTTLTVECFIETTGYTATQSAAINYYFDTLKLDDVMVDDITSVNTTPGNLPTTSWQVLTADTTSGTDRGASASTDRPDTEAWFALDYIVYSALGSWAKKNGTLSATSDHFGFATLNDNVYLNSAHDTLLKFDGTNVTALAASLSPPRGGFLIEHKRRLWTAGDYADNSMLSYCDVDEPEDWIGGGDIRLAGKDSGGRCTGIAPFDNKVFYFSDSRIYAIDPTGPDTNWTASMAGYNAISWSLGCIAPKSLVQTDNALIFLSADGVRAYGYIPGLYSQDGSGLIDLSENIRPTLDTISHAMRDKAVGAFYNGRYYLACALDGATSNNAILVYTLPTQGKPGAWTKYVGTDTKPLSVTCFAVTRGDEYGLYAGTTGGHIIRLDDGLSDDGENIVMVYKTPQLAPNGFETIKHFSTLHLAGESSAEQSLSIKIDTDDVEIGTVSAQFGSGTAAQPVRLSISSRGRSVQYTLTGSGQAQPLTISRLTTQYLAQRVR